MSKETVVTTIAFSKEEYVWLTKTAKKELRSIAKQIRHYVKEKMKEDK